MENINVRFARQLIRGGIVSLLISALTTWAIVSSVRKASEDGVTRHADPIAYLFPAFAAIFGLIFLVGGIILRRMNRQPS